LTGSISYLLNNISHWEVYEQIYCFVNGRSIIGKRDIAGIACEKGLTDRPELYIKEKAQKFSREAIYFYEV